MIHVVKYFPMEDNIPVSEPEWLVNDIYDYIIWKKDVFSTGSLMSVNIE